MRRPQGSYPQMVRFGGTQRDCGASGVAGAAGGTLGAGAGAGVAGVAGASVGTEAGWPP